MKYRFDIAIGTTDALPLERYVFDSFAGPLLQRAQPVLGNPLANVHHRMKAYLPTGAAIDTVGAWDLDEVTFGFGTSYQLTLAAWDASTADHLAPGLADLFPESSATSHADRVVTVGSWSGQAGPLSVVLPVAAQIAAAHPTAVGWMGHPDTSVYASERWRPFGPDRGPFGAI